MIIGITGTIGAGKGTVVDYLVAKQGFRHYSVRACLVEEIRRRGLPVDRDSMTTVANDLRVAHGPEYFTMRLLGEAQDRSENAVIESIRTIGEASYLKSQGASLWAVDAEVRTRYDRILARASETDHISFDKFLADEACEMANDDPTKQNISGVVALADVVLHNIGSKEDLYRQVDRALTPLATR